MSGCGLFVRFINGVQVLYGLGLGYFIFWVSYWSLITHPVVRYLGSVFQ